MNNTDAKENRQDAARIHGTVNRYAAIIKWVSIVRRYQ